MGCIAGKSICQIVWWLCILKVWHCWARFTRLNRCCCAKCPAKRTTVRWCSTAINTSIGYHGHSQLNLIEIEILTATVIVNRTICFAGKGYKTSPIGTFIGSSLLCDGAGTSENHTVCIGFTKWHQCAT